VRTGCILSGGNQVKVLAATQSERWCLGEELWHSFGGHRMRYLRLTPQQAKSRLAGDPGLGPATKRHSPRLPLVLIHGLLGYSFSWRHNLEALAHEREVYAVDLLGIGYSDRPRPAPAGATDTVDFGLHATAGRMLEWLQALGLRKVDLLGTSHGGAVAMMMAALEREHPSGTAVGRLLLAAPANPWSHLGATHIAFFGSSFGRWMTGLFAPTRATSARAWAPSTPGFRRARRAARSLALSRMYGDATKITVETLDGYGRMMDLPGTIEYALEVVRSWKQDMRELKSRFQVLANLPALLLWGSLDRAVAPASAYQLAANLSNARLIVMNGIGHMPYEEAPDEFNRLVLDFLDGGGSPAGPGESTSSPHSQPAGGDLQT
jgi:pimeloyl-ACP methyl ester carboxylesterase